MSVVLVSPSGRLEQLRAWDWWCHLLYGISVNLTLYEMISEVSEMENLAFSVYYLGSDILSLQ